MTEVRELMAELLKGAAGIVVMGLAVVVFFAALALFLVAGVALVAVLTLVWNALERIVLG